MSAIVRERVVEAGAQPIIEQTATFDPSIIVRRSPPPEGFAAHVWMDLSNPAAITMVLLDRTGERGLLRYASRARGDELAQEEIGHVLYQAVRALLAGGKIGIAREEIISRLTPKREEAPTDAEEREERSATTKAEKEIPRVPPAQKEEHAEPHRIFSAHAGFVVHGELFGSAGTNRIGMSSLGFTFDLLARTGPVHVGARFCGEQRFPVEIDAQGFGLRLEMWALRGEAVLSYFFSTFRLVAGAGAGTDVVHLVPSSADAGELDRRDRNSDRLDRNSDRQDRNSERVDRNSERRDRISERLDRHSERHDRNSERRDRISERHDRASDWADRTSDRADRTSDRASFT